MSSRNPEGTRIPGLVPEQISRYSYDGNRLRDSEQERRKALRNLSSLRQ
jgi:hypothetical protein